MVGSRELAKRQTSPKGIFWTRVPWGGVDRIDKEQLKSADQEQVGKLVFQPFSGYFIWKIFALFGLELA